MAIAAQHKPLPDIAEQWGWNGMSVIAVVSAVAGLGKTAFAAHIAIQAGRAGAGPAAIVKAKRAFAQKGGGLAGTLKLGAELAKSFGEGGTIIEDRPNSRAARDIVELWATLRHMRAMS